MDNNISCLTCKKNLANSQGSVSFPCPNCTKHSIVRCKHCREIAASYSCPACGFTGPA